MKEEKDDNNYIRKDSTDSNRQMILTEYIPKEISFERKGKKNLLLNTIIIILIIIIYFSIVIWSETLYRDILFQKGIPLQEYIQRNEKYLIFLKICKIISFLGKELWYVIIFAVIFLLMPINFSFLFLQALVYSSYGNNALKMIYQSERPSWISEYLTFTCNYGYGNPSGHSFTCICVYLTLVHILINYFKMSLIVKIITFSFFIIISFLIIISRVIIGAHSINQVLYGFNLGLGVYFILIYIIGYHKYNSISFFKHIKNIKINCIYYLIHSFLLFIDILIYFKTKSIDHTLYEKNIFNGIRCKRKYPFNKYKNNGFFQSLIIISLLGAQLGINLLFKILKKKNYIINSTIIDWNKIKYKNIFIKIPIILFSSFGIILYFIIPDNSSLIIIFLFKCGIPFFLSTFGIYFVGIYLCISLKFANSEIYKMDSLQEITSSE